MLPSPKTWAVSALHRPGECGGMLPAHLLGSSESRHIALGNGRFRELTGLLLYFQRAGRNGRVSRAFGNAMVGCFCPWQLQVSVLMGLLLPIHPRKTLHQREPVCRDRQPPPQPLFPGVHLSVPGQASPPVLALGVWTRLGGPAQRCSGISPSAPRQLEAMPRVLSPAAPWGGM